VPEIVPSKVRSRVRVRRRRRRKAGINVNAITQRIVVFLRDVDLRVSLNAAQHGKAENRNY